MAKRQIPWNPALQVKLKLEDRGSNELFAACPVEAYPGPAIESVTDSSRSAGTTEMPKN